jgi:RNA polymerase sigma factor (sigma-70 family)
MNSTQIDPLLRFIRQLAVGRIDNELPDHQLLERFATLRDESAFAALLRRHGPMVLSVCRSVLHNVHDAEDAFQAAFLVLARKAGSIQRRESVSSWLYRVAYHLAVKAQANAARRKNHEKRAAVMPSADPLLDLNLRELRGVLYEELDRLPEHYRSALVLCYLEEKTQEEAARLLGWSKGAVIGRLQRGRELLRKRLRRRGLALSVSLVASALGVSAASATVPTDLSASTLQAALKLAAGTGTATGLVSADVAALVEGASTMFVNKTKLVTVLLLSLGVGIAGLAAVRHGVRAANPPEDAKTVQATKQENRPALSNETKQESKESIEISGRVLDPDGKPFAGVRLHLAAWTPKGFRVEEGATSSTDGRFSFTFAKSKLDPTNSSNPLTHVVATAEGYGFDIIGLGQPGAKNDLTLRLVKDVPIGGRVIDSDGKPVVGAKVSLRDVQAFAGEDLTAVLADVRKGGLGIPSAKSWSGPLPGHPREATTGADGRFRLPGLGRERLVVLQIEGPAIHYTTLQVMTRSAETVVGTNPYRPQKIYGATFDYIAEPSRPLRGVVRDKDTGKPIPDMQISSQFATTHITRTDKDGRYELLGCRKANDYTVSVAPTADQPYPNCSFRFRDTAGLTPLATNIDLLRGIRVCGRLTDKATGKPIANAVVEYRSLFPNPYAQNPARGSMVSFSARTNPNGDYALVVLPGPGVIGVTAINQTAYTTAHLTLKQMEEFFKESKNWSDIGGNSENSILTAAGGRAVMGMVQDNFNLLSLIEPEEKATVLRHDLALQPARTLKGSVVGPDGKPLAGAIFYGVSPNVFEFQTLTTDTFIVTGLNPRRSRSLLFYHKEKNLGFYKVIDGNESGPLKIQLQPCGTATGRIVDRDGQPVPEWTLRFCRGTLIGPGAGPEAKTDKDGRFHVTGLVPGQKYSLTAANSDKGHLRADPFTLKTGEAKNLGDVSIELNR